MSSFPFGESATFIARTVTGRDSDGNDTFTDVSTVIAGCGFDPGGSFESLASRDQVTTQPTLFAPPGATIPAAVDRVIVRGDTYDVDGEPADYVNPFSGRHPGPLVRLKRVTG